jgi:hypothetical protein
MFSGDKPVRSQMTGRAAGRIVPPATRGTNLVANKGRATRDIGCHTRDQNGSSTFRSRSGFGK